MPLFAKKCHVVNGNWNDTIYYTMLRSPSFNSTCLIQCISCTVVNCIYKYYTMLLSPSFNSIYKIIQCCKKVPTLHQYSTRLIWRISACVLRHDISGVTTLLSIWLPPVTVLPLYWLPLVTVLPLYRLPLCNILFFATLWTLLIYHAFYFLALAVGLPLITLACGGWLIASYVCSVIDAWKLWSIMNTTYLSCVLFFLALAVGLSLITWGGGGGLWLVTSYVSFFPFLSPVNSFLHLFATFCSDFATFWTLLIYHAFYFFAHVDGLQLITWGGGGSAVYNQCLAIKTKACLFFASRGPAIRWAWTFYFFLIDAGDNS